MTWHDLVSDVNRAEAKARIYDNYQLDQQCPKGKRLLKIKNAAETNGQTNQKIRRHKYKPSPRPKSQSALKKPLKRPRRTRRKAGESNWNNEKVAPWPLRVISKPGRSTKTLRMSTVTAVIRKVIMSMSIRSRRSQRTNGPLGNLHVDDY